MAMKKMYLANFNLTFGLKDEPLLNWIDEFVIPALNSGIVRELSNRTKIMFMDVKIEEIEEENLVLTGVIIKDTVLDIYTEYDNINGLVEKDEHYKTAPYSTFVIYLNNHRMFLVKNQNGSPDLRLFSSSVGEILKSYRKIENERRKTEKIGLLPYAIMGIKDIKTAQNIEEALKTVKKNNKIHNENEAKQ